jgi:hypothetical protein
LKSETEKDFIFHSKIEFKTYSKFFAKIVKKSKF